MVPSEGEYRAPSRVYLGLVKGSLKGVVSGLVHLSKHSQQALQRLPPAAALDVPTVPAVRAQDVPNAALDEDAQGRPMRHSEGVQLPNAALSVLQPPRAALSE